MTETVKKVGVKFVLNQARLFTALNVYVFLFRQVISLVLCLSLVRGQRVLYCQDQGVTPPSADDPLAKFSSYPQHHLRVSDKLLFQQLSVKECAQLCFQVNKGQMFNCSSFEHVTATSDCLLMGFSCQNNKLLFDGSRDFYQLKGPNGTTSCEILPASSSVHVLTSIATSVIRLTPTIHTSPALSSVTENSFSSVFIKTTNNYNTSSTVSSIAANNISSAFILPAGTIHTESAVSSIAENNTSSAFLQLAGTIHTSSKVSLTTAYNISSGSIHTASVFSSMTANNTSSAFIQPTTIIHTSTVDSSIVVNNKSVPGTPPDELKVTIISPTVLHISWSPGDIQQLINPWGFRIVYKASNDNETKSIVVGIQRTDVNISGLITDTRYTIWVMSLTAKGFGVPSNAVNITTPHQALPDIIINITILLINTTWNVQFENRSSEAFKNLSYVIEQSIRGIHQGNSTYNNISNLQFSNHSSGTVAFMNALYDRNSTMNDFHGLYEALYGYKRLQDLPVEVFDDNIPGKPPTNITSLALSTSSIKVSWDLPRSNHCEVFLFSELRVFYAKDLRNVTLSHSVDVNRSTNRVVIQHLEPFESYLIWLQALTTGGLGPKSKTVQTQTLEKVISVNVTLQLNVPWVQALLNDSIDFLSNLTERIERNVYYLYRENKEQLRSVVCNNFRNDSDKVVADIEIIFGQHVEMELFITLYQALYRNGSFGGFAVEPMWDNIPGKPPNNLSAHATSTTSIGVKWNTLPIDSDILLVKIFYTTANQNNETIWRTDVNASKNSAEIGNLGKFVNYTVWTRSVSRRGLGTASFPVYVRTLEEVVPVSMTVRLNDMKWNSNLSNSESEDFKNFTSIIQQNVLVLYGQESNYIRDVQCHRFRNGSVLADLTIVYAQNVGPQQFAVIYQSLYEDGTLGNLSVQPVSDNVPGKPPVNVSAESKTSTSIQVTWLCADCRQHNSTIGLLVSYKLNSNSNQTAAVVVNGTVRQFLIRGLRKFTNYTVHVSSVTARGIGVASERASARTLEDVPSLAPLNLRARNTSSTSLLVAWEPLPNDHVNGILLGYKVTYKKHGESHASKQNTNTTLNYTVLDGLEKFTVYEVNVSAFTRVGHGPSANVTVSTDQDVPSLPPVDIWTYNTSSTSLMVMWNPIPQGFAHGILLGYLVLYKRERDVNNSYTNITSQVTSVELRELDKFTMYVVKLLAFTIKGNGAMSNATRARTHEDVPSLPPMQLASYNASSTSLMVTWLPVPEGYVHGILRGYRVFLKKEQTRFYDNATTVNQSLELTGLQKFTNYSVRILAFTRIGDGNVSDPIIVSTDQDVPSLPPQHVSSHNTSSTSLHVRWHEVPHGFVHGILLGYRVLYRIASGPRNHSIATTLETTREEELLGLKKFTIYEISVLAFTAIGDGANSTGIFVSTDEDIPSLPPVDLSAHNTSSTSIQVTWGEVPQGHVHGILQGYRVFYKRTGDKNISYVNETTGPAKRELHITGLLKFTKYSVKVLAFTKKGDGAVSVNISVLTDEDVPSLPPQSVQSYNTSSTSVNVTWYEVPTGFVHGILRGYRILYSRTKDNGANVRQVIVPANRRYIHLEGLDKFTNYMIQVAAFTRIGYGAKSRKVIVSTDEDVPSLPPQKLWANNISSTAMRTKWNPVPLGFVHGILRGYKVLYRKTNEPSAPYTRITVLPGVRLNEINDLKKFTYYTIRVLAFTIKGDGAQSPPVNVTTDEDIPSEQPQNVYAKDRASATEIFLSWGPPPKDKIHGILRGYFIWYGIIKLGIHEQNTIFPRDYMKKRLSADSNKDTLTDLKSYARYRIRIAAFTSKGYGTIREISTRTCRCRSKIPTNWWNNPPYVTTPIQSNRSTEGGIIPTILKAIVTHCCQDCDFGSTKIDFTTDANGLKAEKTGVIQVKDAISTKTMISFGIAGVMPQETYHSPDGEAEYVPIMETPGVAFIVAERRDIHKQVLMAILSCWPAVVIACIMAYLAGVVVWALDMNWNHVDFPKSFISGSFEGLWWSFVTMTTVGYGDRIPKSIPSRLFAFLWTWIGIATIAVITSSITASLMGMVFQPDKMLYGTKVAAIANSTEYKLGLRRNAKLDTGRSYGNLYEIYEDLEKDRVHAALLDSYSTASESKRFSKDWIRVIEIIPVRYESANGVVLTGDTMKLARCFRRYVRSETSDIHRTIQSQVGSIEAEDVPFAVKTSSELLTEESYLYVQTVIILGGALGTFTLLGLLFHYCFYKKTLLMNTSDAGEDIVVVTTNGPRITHSETIQQLKEDIAEFYETFKNKYLTLRRKHIKELKKLRRLTNEKIGAGSACVKRLPEFSANRRGHYVVTKDVDVNSIFEGVDMSIFDKRKSQRWRL